MKKLLLILICLFVSFEVKSEEIYLSCKMKEKIYDSYILGKKKMDETITYYINTESGVFVTLEQLSGNKDLMIQLHKTNKRIDGSDFENDFLETEQYYKYWVSDKGTKTIERFVSRLDGNFYEKLYSVRSEGSRGYHKEVGNCEKVNKKLF